MHPEHLGRVQPLHRQLGEAIRSGVTAKIEEAHRALDQALAKPTTSVKGLPCIFCQDDSSPSGEHVVPQGVNRAIFPPATPTELTAGTGYTTDIDNVRVSRRDGDPRINEDIARFKVPCCTNHNAILYERFEKDAQKHAITVMKWAHHSTKSQRHQLLDATSTELFGTWALKTVLLWHNPWLTASDGIRNERFVMPDDLYSWMVDGNDPPSDLKLWATTKPKQRELAEALMVRPVISQRATIAQSFGLAQIEFRLLAHPGWDPQFGLRYPGVQLWPPRPHPLTGAELLAPAIAWQDLFGHSCGWMLNRDIRPKYGPAGIEPADILRGSTFGVPSRSPQAWVS